MSTSYPNLGKYQIIEEIGRGGMGAVYKGHDPFLNRTVAIKLLAPHLAWETAFVERFMREARAVAQLRHPNIIDVYDVGQDGANYYFVMAYLPGMSLGKLVGQKGRMKPVEALPILRQLADALDYAHSKGLIHRDVKPANVMFDERGQAVLMDFGIVKAAEQSRLTSAGTSIGTPHYMAPEQIQGKDIDAHTDQYALGIIAFEMLTGRVPFDAPTTTAILLKQVNEPPPSLSACCPDLPPATEVALNRALSKSPNDRYASCGEFVRALEWALAQSAAQPQARPQAAPHLAPRPIPVSTMPPTPKSGIPAWAWALGVVGALVACLAGVGATIAIVIGMQGNLAPGRTQATNTTTPMSQFASAISPGNSGQVTQLAIWNKNIAKQIAWSPDGKLLAIASDNIYFCDAQMRQIRLIETGGWVTSVAFSPDGATLAAASRDGVKLWEVASGRELRTLAGPASVNRVAFSPDGTRLALSVDTNVKMVEVASGRELRTLAGHKGSVNTIAFSPDGQKLASGAYDGIKVWEVASGRELHTLTGHTNIVSAVAFSPDGRTLASGAADKSIKLWEVASGRELNTLAGQTNSIESVAYSPDGRLIASSALDGLVTLWDAASGRELQTLTGHTDRVPSIAFSPDGATLASGANDSTVRLWGVR